MPVLESLFTKLLADLIKAGIISGYEAFTSSKYNDYEKELINIIEKSTEEYKINNSIRPVGKIAFYESQALINELVKFRFTKKLDLEEIQKNVGEDTRIQMPTKSEIDSFLGIFSKNIKQSENLKSLNISNNYQEETFNISEKLDKLGDRILSEIAAIKNQIAKIPIANDLSEEWSRQLDEISSNIEAFKPKTALERLENLEKAIANKGVSVDSIEGRLLFLKASCLTGLDDDEIKKPQATLYIKASNLCPNNVEFRVNAAMSYDVLNERQKAEVAANEILAKDELHFGGWLVKCYLSENNISEFLKTVPLSVRENRNFKRNLCHWLTAKQFITEFNEIDGLGLGFDIEAEKSPEKITSRNIGYWVLVINYLLNKLYYEHPVLGGTGPETELYKNPAFLYLKNLLNLLVTAVEGTEIEAKYNWHKFNFMYYEYMESNEIKSANEIEKVFVKIKKKRFAEYVQMVQVLNSLKQEKETRRAIELVNEFGEKKNEILCLFNSFNKLETGDIDGSISSFKHFLDLNEIIAERAFFNVFAYTNLIMHVNPNKLDAVSELVLAKEFKSVDFKDLYNILRPTESERKNVSVPDVKVKIDNIQSKIPNSNVQLRYYVALAYYNYGFCDEAVSYLRDVVGKSKPSNELKLYCLSLYNGNGNKLELLEILKTCRNSGHKDYDLLAQEITLRQTLKDWDSVIEVTRYGLHWYPGNEKLLHALFYAYERQTDIEEIKRDSHLVHGKTFENELLAVNLAGILQRAGVYDEAIRILYEVSSKTANAQIRQHYFMATGMYPPGILVDLPKAEIGSYVKYTFQESVNIIALTEESVKSFPGCVLIGRQPQEKFMWKRPMSDVYAEGTVIRVMNKYLALFEEILLEVENPAKGYEMKSMSIEGEFDVKKFQEKLIAEFGYQGSSNKQRSEEILEEYYSGKISFSEVCKSLFDENCVDAYYLLTNQAKLFKGISSGVSTNVVIDEKTKFVLDFTSLCLFFDLSQERGLKFMHKFVISAFIVNEINKLIENTKLAPGEKLSMEITMEGVKGHRYEKDFKQKRLEFLSNIRKWINDNCVTDSVDEKLNFIGPVDKKLTDDEYILYLTDNRLLTDRGGYILLTNDIAYYRHMNGDTNDIVSPEKYLKAFFSEKMPSITNYMLNRNYVGIEMNMELMQEEYVKSLSGKENRFLICLENLNLRWNPHQAHIELTVQFLKWLYLTNFISVQLKRPTAFTVLTSILRGANKIHVDSLRGSLKENFKLMGDYFTEIQIILLEALKSIKQGT
jgi:hypothetical protein